MLDLVLVNNPLIVDNLEIGPPLGNSVHNTVMIDLLVNTALESTDSIEILPKMLRYDFHIANWVALCNALRKMDWYSILYNTPVPLREVINEYVHEIEND